MCTALSYQKISKKSILILFFILGLGSLTGIFAQTYYSIRSGDWNDATPVIGTWSTASHAGLACSCIPTAGSTVLIGNGHTVTYKSGAPASISIAALTLHDAGASGALVFGSAATATTLTITGDLTINASGSLTSGATGANAHDIILGGNLINNGTYNQGANAATNQSITFNSASARVIRGTSATTTVNNLNITGAGGVSFGDNTATARTLTVVGNLTIAASATLQSANSAAVAHTINLAGNVTNNGTFNLTANAATSHTAIFNASSTKTISGSGSNTFNNLSLQTTSSSNVSVTSSLLINGVLNFINNGLLVVDALSNITLGALATITGPTASRYIQLDGGTGSNSNLIKTSNGTTASWQITYPIGTATGGYSSLVLPTVAGTAPTAGSTISVKAIYNNSIQGQLRRTFRVVVNGNAAATTFTSPQFNYNTVTDVSGGDALANYSTLWHLNSTTGSWATLVGTAPGAGMFTLTTPTHNLITGTYYYTIGSSTAYPNTWYSYQSGNWSDWFNWTLDPSATTLVNGLQLPPQPGDEIVILNGIVITNNVSGQVTSSATVQAGGTLDMAATTGNTLGTVSGAGLLRVQGINLPTGTYTSFVTAGTGGTVEYYNTGGTLPSGQTTYNKLIFSNTTGSAITFISASNLTINSDFNITQTSGAGTVTWQINDATATARTLSIAGNLTVSANAKITVGIGAAVTQHALTLAGNFTNNGVVQFFDPTDAAFSNANYTSGATWTTALKGNAVNVTCSGTPNRTITCNNQTDFYRLIVNKGVNQQPILTVYSSGTANFRLFGPNNIDNNTLTLTNNALSNESLSLQNGTLQLTGFITIPNLIVATGAGLSGGWPIPQSAALWVNSATVSIQVTTTTDLGDNGRQIYDYGLLRLTNGTINMGYSRGLLGGGSGVFLVEGGTLNTRQFRTTYLGANNRFSYTQTGGTVNIGTTGITGVDVNTYPRFALPYPECTFVMTGGTLNVADPMASGTSINGGILISSATSNISVTGGDVNITLPASAINFTITSTAAFYNLFINKAAGAGASVATLNSMTFNDGSNFIRPVQPLTLTNNLTLVTANGPTLSCNNQNLTVGGNFDIQTSTTFTPGTNTVTFSGAGAQTWTHNGTISSLNNVVVNKSAGTLTLAGANIFPAIAGTPVGLTLTAGTLNDGGKTITVTGAINNSAIHASTGAGVLIVNGATAIGGAGGTFGNLTVQTNNTVTTSGAQTVTGSLILQGASTSLSIASNQLTVNGSITAGVAFGNSCRIMTNGLRNDGGLTRTATSTVDLLFPVGTSTIVYTPVTLNVTATTAGTITVRPVKNAHPNVTAATQTVQYFWRVTSSGFAGITAASHKSYTYSNATRDAASVNYRPARYNPATFTWAYGPVYDATTPTGTTKIPDFNTATGWTGLATTQLDGEYTAGNVAAFGVVAVYYSKVNNGNWNTAATWSNDAGRVSTAVSLPCATCPVVIGDGSTFNHTIIINANNITCGSLDIAQSSVLNCGSFTGLNFGTNPGDAVVGRGTLRIDVAVLATGNFPAGDFTTFIGANGGTVEWYGSTTTTRTLPTTGPAPQNLNLSTYYNLIVNPVASQTIMLPGVGLTVYNTLTKTGAGIAATNTTAIYAVNINGNFLISQGSFVPQDAFGTTFTVVGNTTVASGAFFSVPGGGGQVHTFTTSGNFTNNGTIDFRNGSVINMIFTGTAPKNFSGPTATLTRINNLTINKGTDQTPVLTFDVLGTSINALTTGWLTLTNGTLNFNNSASFSLNTAASSYAIPSTARLKVSAGTVDVIGNVNNDAGDLLLSGGLEVSGGTVNINPVANNSDFNNDIEYSSAGTPTIVVSSGTLYVNGAIRRSTSSLSGSLIYNQSGGTVTVGGRNCDVNNTRGVFEIENNTGSSFTLSNGTLNVRRSTGGSSFADLYINPAVTSAAPTNGLIQLGMDVNTAVTTPLSMNIVPTVFNFSLLNAGTAQVVNMRSSDLTSSGTVTINTNSTLQTNALNVNIGGNLSITGIYNGTISGGNTTTFNGAGAQTGDLTAGSTFQNITINKSSGVATLNGTTSINNLNILSGGLSVSGTLNINGDIINNSAQTGAGIISIEGLVTTSAHSITSSGGSFTNLSLGGTSTTKKVTVTGDLTINGNLNFTAGGTSRYLFIQSNQLNFGSAATVSNASTTRFIRTNGVSSDLGVVKTWPVGTTSFTYPVGTRTNYTPVIFTGYNVTTAGDLTVIPVDDQHPTATAMGEQILNYYWIVKRNIALVFTAAGTHAYQFPTGFIGGSGGTLIGAYLDAINLIGWTSGGTFTSSPPNTTMTFTTSLANLPGTSGEFNYAAGTMSTLTTPVTPLYSRIENATTVGNLSVGGDWNLASNWTTSSTGIGGTVQSTMPVGRPLVILAATRINMNIIGLRAFSTQINGLMVIVNPTGHNLGIMSGTGTLRTSTSTLPAGNYTSFVSATGGTIEYVATANINMNSRNTYNHLSIVGPNALTMTNIDLTLNGNVTIAPGATLNNTTNNRTMTIAGNMVNAGTFLPGSGTTTLAGNWSNTGTFTAATSTVNFNGGVAQAISGSNTFYNLGISKSVNVLTLNAPTTVTNVLTLTTGNIISTTTNPLILTSAATISGGSSSSYVSGVITKTFSGSFTFPVGANAVSKYRPAIVGNTSGADTWTIEYVGKDPSIDGFSHKDYNTANLGRTSMFEYWNVSRLGATTADLTLTYNTGSYIPPNIGTVSNLRISHWDALNSRWDLPSTSGGVYSQSGTNITGTVTVTNVTSFSPFTFGSLDTNSPLPVGWLSFTAKRVDHTVVLDWKTAQELNNDHFEVERSVDGKTFSKIGSRAGAGTSKVTKSYQFIDSEVSSSSAYYYRIKQIDLDGKSDYSQVVLVPGNGASKQRWIAMPNPVGDQSKFHIELADLSVAAEHLVQIQVISSNGVLVYEGKGALADLNPILENQMLGLGAGVYLVQIVDDTLREHFKIIRH